MSDISYAYPLILNKVASPQYTNATLRRARLVDWLNDVAGCRATVIAADPGYGKTTLLWQWEREVEFPCYWYKLDRQDRDWTFHISYLIEAISKRHPGFGQRANSMLQQMGGPGTSRPGVTAYLLAEMHQRLTEPCTFIIDDWQYVNAVTEVRGLWNQLLRDAPPTCRFVFASRAKPKLQFARFKTHGGYAELRTDALRFSESEISDLFRDTYNDPLNHAEIAEIERRTEGWAASLQLVEVSLRERPSQEERQRFIHSITATRDSDLFDFLAEEVLDQQPQQTRDFLLSTSILQQITPAVAERLTGVHNGAKELLDLEQRGLFTNRLDDERFRYHTLFREFLERRLTSDRSETEVVGLHIHAASYFETAEVWPESIHHYLAAGLQKQAARLIARYGEDVVAEGRLGLVDQWLQQLPPEAIKQNSRLTLLYGEACGIRGDWDLAWKALKRARAYFSKSGDRRFEALACLKLSSVYSYFGDPTKALAAAEEGLALVPRGDVATRLRLEGNLAITQTWTTGSLAAVARECQRIAVEASARGLDHFAAIAHHNLGGMQLRMGEMEEAVSNLERAARFWSDPPTSPFADNSELVMALLTLGKLDRAQSIAAEAVQRTSPWPRPRADALFGQAAVFLAQGRPGEAVTVLRDAAEDPTVLGALHGLINARLIEALYLADAGRSSIHDAQLELLSRAADPRYDVETAPARAIAIHTLTGCTGDCLTFDCELQSAGDRGATGTALTGRVKMGLLRLSHRRQVRQAWDAVEMTCNAGRLGGMRWWIRKYAPHVRSLLRRPGGIDLLTRLAADDAEGWRDALVDALRVTQGRDRQIVLAALSRHANRRTLESMRLMPGDDVAEARRRLQHIQAARLFLRTFGGISLHRGNWNGPALTIEKKRVRMLLALLAARAHTTLTRDMATDTLWPTTDADAAVNNLNQTVFQLRRYIDPAYKGGDSPEYVISTSEQVALNSDLVHTDLDEIRRLPLDTQTDWNHRQLVARRAISLVRGEFLADLRYEEWTTIQQISVHNEVRNQLMPIAQATTTAYNIDVSVQAAAALVTLDPYDEAAILALADCLSRSGRRVAARNLIVDYARRLHAELDEAPSLEIARAAQALGAEDRIKQDLTQTESN